MPANDWAKIKRIFHDSLKVDASERDIFIEKACDGDVHLRLEVESLLISLGEAESFLERPVILGDSDEGSVSAKASQWRLNTAQEISHYRVEEPIDSGGMGEVYLATDLKLRRKVALKVLRGEVANDRERLKRFRREAEAVSSLNHPNILTVFDFDEVDEVHFFATELVEGETLRSRLNSVGSLPLVEAVDIALQTALALKAAHEAGVVHRDVKPENLMIRSDGYVKVLDFGLAKVTESSGLEAQTRAPVSIPGMIMGTAAYMSPEQARAISIDRRTDIFSLGVVLYEMIAGFSPFKGDTLTDTIAAIIQRDPKPPSSISENVPAELDRIVLKMIEKDRTARYRNATDLLIDLKQLQKRLEFETELGRNSQPSVRMEAETQVLSIKTGNSISTGGTTGYSNSIAVLPFANMSADAENEYFCDGLAEELLNALAKVEDLKVAARTSAFTFKNRNTEIGEIGRALNVKTILEGSVRKSGNKLRITVQLINAADGFHLWSERFDREMKEIFDVQDEITLAVVDSLKVKLLGEEKAAILKRYSDNAEAYEIYLKGLYHSYKWTDESFLKSLEYFEKALEKDPGFAPAYAKIADYYHFHSFVGGLSPNEVIGKRREAAQRALELDESLPEAHLAMANIYFYHDRNWAKAEDEFQRAIELNPNDPKSHMLYGLFLVSRERFDEAVAEGKKALSLDPLSVAVNFVAAQTNFYADRFEDTLALVRMMRELDPNAPQSFWQEGKLLLANGRYEEAVETLQKASALGDNQMALSMRGCAYALAGRRDEALAILDQLFETRERKYAAAFNIARVYAGLGDRDKAFAWLERAADERNAELVHLKRKVEAGKGLYFGDNFSSDPRYREILRRADLPTRPAPQDTDSTIVSRTVVGPEETSQRLVTNDEATSRGGKAQAKRKWLLFGLLTFVLLAGVFFAYRYFLPVNNRIESVAVMPFVNGSGDPDAEYLSDGITETLISKFSELPGLNVKARASVFTYKGKVADPKTIGKELSVQAVLTGRVVSRGDNLALYIELVDAATGNLIWSDQYNRKQADLVTMQNDIARDVSQKLKARLSGPVEARLAKSQTSDPEAYQLYLKGRFHLNRLTDDGFYKARDYFQQAIDKDPQYALAYAGLADAYQTLTGWNVLSAAETMPKADAAVRKAIELDDTLAEAHATFGIVKLFYDRDWQAAENEFKRALELNPNYADAHRYYSFFLSPMRRFDEAHAEVLRAQELDPLSVDKASGVAEVYYFQGDFDRAVEFYRKAVDLDPNSGFAHWALANALTQKGSFGEAIEEYKRSIPLSGNSPDEPAMLACAYAMSGNKTEARKILAELTERSRRQYIGPTSLAFIHIALGEKDQAFALLDQAFAERDTLLVLLNVEPFFGPIRDDPRFADLVRRVGLPKVSTR